MIGRFIELGIAAERILDSIAFYEDLGFRQLAVGDVWPHPYAVLSDGTVNIGLHEKPLPAPLITFVLPGLAGELNELRSRGMRIVNMKTGDDDFNELTFRTPDGHHVRLLEARTFSPPPFDDEGLSICGAFREITLPVRDTETATASWQRLGFDLLDSNDEPHPHAWLRGNDIVLGLHQTQDIDQLALSFQATGLSERLAALADKGIHPADGGPPGVGMIVSPEGLPLLLHGE